MSNHTEDHELSVGVLQHETRLQHSFHSIESELHDPSEPHHLLADLVGYLPTKHREHLGTAVAEGDILWLFDNTAFFSSDGAGNVHWQAEFVASVFAQEPRCRVDTAVASIATKLGCPEGSEERKIIEHRLMPFIWDVRPARKVVVLQKDGTKMEVGVTTSNGISSHVVGMPESSAGSLVTSVGVVPGGVPGCLSMNTVYAGTSGWALVSDIDDTIKLTQTSSPIGILKTTFLDEPTPIAGMPELYSQIKSIFPPDSPFFYLSASPYNLYPFLRGFRDKYYPPGTIILRDSSWKTISGLLTSLTVSTLKYKSDRLDKLHSWLPGRKLICFGDSTQSDPEAYGAIYRAFPGWIRFICIRKATDISEIGLQKKNEPSRFEKAFQGMPPGSWHVYEDPAECWPLIQQVVAQDL